MLYSNFSLCELKMGKDTTKKLEKAEQLYKAMQYKRAAKLFKSLGNDFLNLNNFEFAKDCFFKAAKCLINEKKYFLVVDSLRNAGNASLFKNDFLEAQEFFKDALEYVPSLRNSTDRNHYFILFSCLSYFCSFVEGKREEGINLIKKVKVYVDDTYFKENPLIRLIKDITIAIKDKKESYLTKIEKEFNQNKLREGESLLAKQVLVIVKTLISLKAKINFDKNEYKTNEIITLKLEIDSKALLDISQNSFYKYIPKELKIFKIGIKFSDNFTSHKRPDLPIVIKPGQTHLFEYLIKPHFQMEKNFIGPIILTSELNGNLKFFYKINEILKLRLISPLPTLDISINNLRPPLIGKTFPLEILVENNSEGEALDLNMEVKFPDKIKVIRGTLKKQIYSIKSNENMKWEINLKPLEAGDYIIKIETKFNDPDQNLIEDTKEFPFSIKL